VKAPQEIARDFDIQLDIEFCRKGSNKRIETTCPKNIVKHEDAEKTCVRSRKTDARVDVVVRLGRDDRYQEKSKADLSSPTDTKRC